MTCIVAITADDRIIMGADSAATRRDHLEIRRDKKLFLLGPHYLVGFTSSFRMGQLLMTLDLPEPPASAQPDAAHCFVVQTLVPTIRDHLHTGGFHRDLTIQRDGYSDHRTQVGGLFLLAFRHQLFEISDDFGVGQAEHDYMAIGSGAQPARGSLFSTAGLPPRRRLELGLEAAARHSCGTHPPFHFLELAEMIDDEGRAWIPPRASSPSALQQVEVSASRARSTHPRIGQ